MSDEDPRKTANDDRNDETRDEESRGPAESRSGPEPSEDRPDTVTTMDPSVTAEAEQHELLNRSAPENTVTVQTVGVREPVAYVPGPVRVVETRPRRANDDGAGQGSGRRQQERRRTEKGDRTSRDEMRNRRRDVEDDRRNRSRDRDRAESSSGWLSWLWPGLAALVIGLVAGVGGAWCYMHFFGPSSDQKDQQASSKSDQQNGQGQGKSKSSGESDSDNSGGDMDQAGAIPGFTNKQDAKTLSAQIEHLAHRIDRLSQRVDQMSRPENQTPPDLHTLQIKVGEVAREVDEVANLPERVRRQENWIEDLRSEVKDLRRQLDQTASSGVLSSPGLDTPASIAPDDIEAPIESIAVPGRTHRAVNPSQVRGLGRREPE